MNESFSLKYHYRLPYRRNFNILAEDYKVIYFNTQKNANSTMKAQFVEVLGIAKTKNFPKDIHHKYDFPTASLSDIKSKYQDFLRFSILRNPWERLVSCYKNKIAQNSPTGPDYILKCSPDLYIGMPFEEFVKVVCKIPDPEADYHFCSQSYLMFYPDGYFPMNYLCNMENLAFHVEEIKSLTGIPFKPLPSLNSSKQSAYESFYTPELIEKVRQRYPLDIEFFKYEFGRKNEVFPFGVIGDDLKIALAESPLTIQMLKEKNRELLTTVENIDKRMQPDLEKVLKEIDCLKNSLSWKLTAPLRGLASFFLNK